MMLSMILLRMNVGLSHLIHLSFLVDLALEAASLFQAILQTGGRPSGSHYLCGSIHDTSQPADVDKRHRPLLLGAILHNAPCLYPLQEDWRDP